MEVKNGIIIYGVLHELVETKRNDCSKCSLRNECCGIKLSYEVNGIPYIFHYDLLSELNYEERGYPESVSEKVKHVIADDITEALNEKFKGLKDEALNYAISEFDKRKYGLEATAKIWKHFALIFIITTIVLTIRLFIQL